MPTTGTRSRTVSSDSVEAGSGSEEAAAMTSECSLSMECDEEELSDAQRDFYLV